jgi:hypothetical protein
MYAIKKYESKLFKDNTGDSVIEEVQSNGNIYFSESNE